MKIIVCVKRVPDTATKIKIGKDGKSIDGTGVEYIISPYDEYAMEYAVRIKEKLGNVELAVVSIGPADSEKIVRNCLAMGADRGLLLETAQDLWDPFVIASGLAKVISAEKPDMVLLGIKAVDRDNGQVGGILSALLNMPFIDGAITFELIDTTVKAKLEIEGGHQMVESCLPAILSINKGGVEPRICSLINIRKAKQKELKKIPAELAAPVLQIESIDLPPQRQGGRIVGKGADAVPELFRLLREQAKVL